MSLEVGSSLQIPNFLTAQTPQGLRRLMLLNNLKYGRQYNYFDLQFVNGKWFVWYFDREKVENLLSQADALNPRGAK